MTYEAVIGLEVHAQLKTNSKIFCSCSTEFGASPNTHTCPVCLGMPGTLPVLNKKVVEYAMRMALATQCTIAHESRFARKNYFYPDLPKGYQISQYELPIAEHGVIDIELPDGQTKKIGLTRIHMEEDAGKLVHDPLLPISQVDYNRTGVPLIEIVSEPDMRTPQEASAYLKKLHALVRYTDTCDGNMEQGSFRCDANVSIRHKGETELGTRTELKNMNSFRNVEKAIQYEIDRQIAVVEQGKAVVQETRLFDPNKGKTFSMRGKEEAHDYRYFPDPDLIPLVIDTQWIDRIRKELPELPDARKSRFISDFQLSEYDASVLTADRDIANYFESCLSHFNQPKMVANWVMSNLLGLLHAQNLTIDHSPISSENLAHLLRLIHEDTISGKIAKTVFEEMAATGKTARSIVQQRGLIQVSDENELVPLIQSIIEKHPKERESYQNGKTKLMGFFVGQVMKATTGKANPKKVNALLQAYLSPEKA
ncbi:MAG: Aspartyl/glutamyl-tRNA(Asn/Gln) amidotransferase subunit B [Candidatus Magnetoglobus multicellularis str. Araruama]|uniref:Aspartyl/glutamyl-tRNA(Asn/Gln) amidotransferase subunit B n=1 Tax=Candidatus Magnetoglobus multicellularis str. Araruama TaxID=890399 RepID=A0A1V1PDE0_9BACT|nr:MAG: Aspartyl/glutamyl-tRNA(Asn/Gln) amidotransferase subunit B [Candidatus Magnetoglobus multicellularis str. Araruama]